MERFPGPVWDPCCGQGNVRAALGQAGYVTRATDRVRRGASCEAELDFLETLWREPLHAARSIVSNPPVYRGEGTEDFIRKAVSIPGLAKLAVFADAKFLGGAGRAAGLWAQHPPDARVVADAAPFLPTRRAPARRRSCRARHGRVVLVGVGPDRARRRDATGLAEEGAMRSPLAMPDWPALMDANLAAAYLAMSPSSFQVVAAKRGLRAVKLDVKVTRWRRRDLDALIESLPLLQADGDGAEPAAPPAAVDADEQAALGRVLAYGRRGR